MGKYFILNLVLLLLIIDFGHSQTIPGQFIGYVNENFNRKANLTKYRIEPQNSFELKQREKGDYAFHISSLDSAQKVFFSIDSFMIGEFVLFLDLNLSGGDNCPSTFGLKFTEREGNYYLLKLENKDDILKLGVDIVLDTSIVKLDSIEIDNSFLAGDPWTRFALSRNIIDGSIKVYLHKSKAPVLDFVNRQLILGGIEIFPGNCTLAIDNLKIYTPTVVKEYK